AMSVRGADVRPHGDAAGECILEVAAARGDVAVVAADLDLRALAHAAALGIDRYVATCRRHFKDALAGRITVRPDVRSPH
ncbi:MAG: hypothetical protein RLZZ93_1087, partial [Actinomycetota bacterium]